MTGRKYKVLNFGTLILALNFIPLTALAAAEIAAPAPAPRTFTEDLSYADFKQIFIKNPEMAVSKTNPDQVELRGLVFEDCAAKFQVLSYYENSQAGYQIKDHGGKGRLCMESHKNAHDFCNADTKCKNIGTGIDITLNDEHVSLGWYSYGENFVVNDAPTFSCSADSSDAKGCIGTHLSSAEIYNNHVTAAVDKVCSEINEGDVVRAKTDAQRLKSLHVEKEQIDAILALIDAGTLESIKKCIQDSSGDDLQSCQKNLKAYADIHAKDKKIMDKIGLEYINLAKKYDSAADPSYDDRSSAISVLDDAEGVRGISGKLNHEMESLKNLIKLERLHRLAQDGSSQKLIKDLAIEMKELARNVQNSCRGNGVQSDDCKTAQDSYLATYAGVNQDVQQAQAIQQQIQTALNQSLGGIGQPGQQVGQQQGPGRTVFGPQGFGPQGFGPQSQYAPQAGNTGFNPFGAQQGGFRQ